MENINIEDDFNKKQEQREQPASFFHAIERPELEEIITLKTPWAYWTMEIYREDIKGGGGLGMLASDTLEVAKMGNVPSVFITPFYTKELVQRLENFQQKIERRDVHPEDFGFEYIDDVKLQTIANGELTPTFLKVYKKDEGNVTLITVTEENFGALYDGENNSDHRLYQEVALGVGGLKAMYLLGREPSMNQQLNEAPTVFSALSRLDRRMEEIGDFQQALADTKEQTIYTNHTLVQAVEAEFTLDQMERFVIPNLKHEEIKSWLRNKFNGKGGCMRLSTLAIELAGKYNGVSQIHAREASKVYQDYDGNPVEFKGVTNGISLERWADEELLKYYYDEGVFDEWGRPILDYKERILALDPQRIKDVKEKARLKLREVLKTRKNQYGEGVDVPVEAKILNWKRRFAEYKRPGMVFERPETLVRLLEESNAYLILAGRAHEADVNMQQEITRICYLIDGNPVLKERVHFVENYDEDLAKALAQGGDISLNTPRVRTEDGSRMSTEACGTSWEKDILGNSILISTPDGGVADPEIIAEHSQEEGSEAPFLEISGVSYEEEVSSLYENIRIALDILDDDELKVGQFKKQLEGYLPIISGSRMEEEYLELGFPKKS